jgi:hypothetical protein
MNVSVEQVVGVYDASQKAVERMLNEGVDNQLIPVNTWAAFGEKGGLKGTVDFLPIDMVVKALNECYVAREQTKQVIYDVTGLSDIIRGSSVASETATAQQIKSQYASLRLKRMQIDVAEFTSAMMRIKAQLMADLYPPEQLIEMSGIMGTMDAQYAEPAVQLLKSEPIRTFRIEVATDSLVEMDEAGEKESRVEFLTAVGSFMEKSLPVAQQVPDMAPLIGEMLLFGVRAFKGGRPMEAAFDDAIAKLKAPKAPAPQPPSPEELQAQADMKKAELDAQTASTKEVASVEKERIKSQEKIVLEQQRQQFDERLEVNRLAFEERLEKFKIEQQERTKLEIAQIRDQQLRDDADREERRIANDTAREMEKESAEKEDKAEESNGMKEAVQQIAEVAAVMGKAVEQLSKPRKRVIERDPKSGRAVGMVEVD